MSALRELWEAVYFVGLILAIIALGVIVFVDPFGWQAWWEQHKGALAIAGLACVIAAVMLRPRK